MFNRPARTVVQTIILVIIVGLLAGCILAGIGRMRSAADLQSCRNNLRQIGLGVHNYGDVYDRIQPLTDQGDNAPTGNGLPSLFSTLEPYLESTPLLYRPGESPPARYHAHSSVGYEWYDQKSREHRVSYGGVANGTWRVFLCPADGPGIRDVPMILPDGSTGYYATGSYVANGLLPWGKDGQHAVIASAEASNTILMAERPQVCVTGTGDTVYNLWGVGFYSPHMPAFATLTPTEPAGLWSTGQIAPVDPLRGEGEAIPYRIGRRDAAIESLDIAPVQRIRRNRPCDPRLPGPPHSAGMQVAMCDGSVRVYTTETNAWAFWSACVPPKP